MRPNTAVNILQATGHHNQPVEVFKAILLDEDKELIRVVELARGNRDQVMLDPNMVLGSAKYWGALYVILSHNHPGESNPVPSQADLDVTKYARRYLRPYKVKVLDHIILGSDDYISITRDYPSRLRRFWAWLV